MPHCHRRIRSSLGELFPNYEQVADLIGNPAVLAMVRGLAEQDKLDKFERRGDLYEKTGYKMMQPAAVPLGEVTDPTAIERTQARRSRRAAEPRPERPQRMAEPGGILYMRSSDGEPSL